METKNYQTEQKGTRDLLDKVNQLGPDERKVFIQKLTEKYGHLPEWKSTDSGSSSKLENRNQFKDSIGGQKRSGDRSRSNMIEEDEIVS